MLPDRVDVQLLGRLQAEGRISFAELTDLGLTAQAIGERVRRLVDQGFIRGFAAVVDPQRLGLGVLAFVALGTAGDRAATRLLARLRADPRVLECHRVAGDADWLLKVRVPALAELELLLTELKGEPPVRRLDTTMVLSTAKESLSADLSHLQAAAGR